MVDRYGQFISSLTRFHFYAYRICIKKMKMKRRMKARYLLWHRCLLPVTRSPLPGSMNIFRKKFFSFFFFWFRSSNEKRMALAFCMNRMDLGVKTCTYSFKIKFTDAGTLCIVLWLCDCVSANCANAPKNHKIWFTSKIKNHNNNSNRVCNPHNYPVQFSAKWNTALL